MSHVNDVKMIPVRRWCFQLPQMRIAIFISIMVGQYERSRWVAVVVILSRKADMGGVEVFDEQRGIVQMKCDGNVMVTHRRQVLWRFGSDIFSSALNHL